MAESRAAERGLNWWLEFAFAREGTFDMPHAETTPHRQVVVGRTPAMSHEDINCGARADHTPLRDSAVELAVDERAPIEQTALAATRKPRQSGPRLGRRRGAETVTKGRSGREVSVG